MMAFAIEKIFPFIRALVSRLRPRRGMLDSFGEVLEIGGKTKDERFMRRMAVYYRLGRIADAEILIKSNITKYVKRISDSFVTDLGASDAKERERILLAGRIFENELILRQIRRAQEFYKTKDGADDESAS